VAHILEGSVRKSGNRVRITAQLIDTGSDRHLWSETFDRELTDIFAIQDEIANAIVAALRETLGENAKAPVVVRADTENLQAYDLYLKARELFIARSELSESVRLFERAVELDPSFARGWEGLAAVTSVVESWGIDDRDYNAMVRPAAERALKLDPTLSMAWAALSMAEQNQISPDWASALELAGKAIEADSKNATAHLWRSIIWLNLGFFDRALADLDGCLRTDPAYRNCTRWKARALLFAGDARQALSLFEQGVASGFIVNLAIDFVPAMVARGDTLAARLLLDKLQVSAELTEVMIEALVDPGTPRPNAAAIIEKPDSGIIKANSGLGLTKAIAYLWAGDFERAADANDGGTNDSILAWKLSQPAWRNSPGFKRTLQNNGVLGYWQAHGFPPQCRALGETDFECDSVAATR
jgi:tetratricopeptide (TPR) repeat protein